MSSVDQIQNGYMSDSQILYNRLFLRSFISHVADVDVSRLFVFADESFYFLLLIFIEHTRDNLISQVH